ncbi:MAG: polysaccharide lyase 6 family protein [Phycisphaeraceae bacterium]
MDIALSSATRSARKRVPSLTLVIACLAAYSPAVAADFFVNNLSQFNSAVSSANPGDTITLANGVWTNTHLDFATNGTSGNPVTLRAETPGSVVFNGNSRLSISGDWLVVDGLKFQGGSLSSDQHVIEFRGSNGNATNSRLTNTAIIDYNPPSTSTRYFWVSIYGNHNRVDHNYFENQNHSGVTVVDWVGKNGNNSTGNNRIDSNYFFNRPSGGGANGWETIRIGDSANSMTHTFDIIENNLFHQTDGEIEIISNKTGSNIYRNNTFLESAGTLTLRHGNNALVEGNFFLGNGKSQTGGIRVIGEDHTVINNYLAGLDGRNGGAISISAGVPNSALNEYFQVKNAVIAFNTIVDVSDAAIKLDDGLGSSGRTLLAENVTLANNLIRNFASTSDPIFQGNEGVGWTWEGNIAWGKPLGTGAGNPGVLNVDPIIALAADGLWRPQSGSPAIDGAVGNYTGILTEDVDGQTRIGTYDIGADEVSAAQILRRPLMPGDVGPLWMFPQQQLDGDLDGDGFVGINDLNIVLGNWNSNVTAGSLADGDPSGDGFVGIEDLNLILGNWNAGVPPTEGQSIPEPASLMLLGGLSVLMRNL